MLLCDNHLDCRRDRNCNQRSQQAGQFRTGIIGYWLLQRAELPAGGVLGLYGFGASAHLLIQFARYRGSDVYVCAREPRYQALGRELDAAWVGAADDKPPVKLRSSTLFGSRSSRD